MDDHHGLELVCARVLVVVEAPVVGVPHEPLARHRAVHLLVPNARGVWQAVAVARDLVQGGWKAAGLLDQRVTRGSHVQGAAAF